MPLKPSTSITSIINYYLRNDVYRRYSYIYLKKKIFMQTLLQNSNFGWFGFGKFSGLSNPTWG